MREEFNPAIQALQADLMELERKANEIKSAINTLCRHAGREELYPNIGEASGSASLAQLRADTFYGKPIGQAAREYLEMRRAAGSGPAKPREIYEALVKGGMQFGSDDEQSALVTLRATIRKNSKTFHKLPNGEYGLLAWYPKAKAAKSSDEGNDTDEDGDSSSGAKNTTTADDDSPAVA